jgi:hypothetical protein
VNGPAAGVRWSQGDERRLVEQDSPTYLPGDMIRMRVEIRHIPIRLHKAGVVFRHEEETEGSELYAVGVPGASGNRAAHAPTAVGGPSVAELTLEVPRRAAPGVYKVDRMWVETFGGRVYRYQRDELGGDFGFEIAEEPGEKPDLKISFAE